MTNGHKEDKKKEEMTQVVEGNEEFEVDFDSEPEKAEKKEKKPKDKKEKKLKEQKEKQPKVQKEKKPKKKKKKSKRLIVLAVILLLAAIFVLPRLLGKGKNMAATVYTGDIYTAGTRTVEDTVSATGLVESHEDTTAKVFSTLAYKIDTVNVSVGDTVSEDDILCVYDTETLDRAIREKELSMSASARSASLNLANAKLSYDTFLAGMNNGTNASINSATSAYNAALENYERAECDLEDYIEKNDSDRIVAVNSAKRDLDNAKKDYEDFKKELDEGTNLQLRQAKRSLDTALDNYEEYEDLVDDLKTPELISAEANLTSAETAYVGAKAAIKSLESKYDNLADKLDAEESKEEPDASKIAKIESDMDKVASEISKAEETLEGLQSAYYAAEDAYDMAHTNANLTLETYKTTYENAKDNYDAVAKSLDDQLVAYEQALDRANDAYTTALENVGKQVDSYQTAFNNAKRNLDDATLALSNAKIAANDQLEAYRIAYQNAQNGTDTALADYQLANLYEDLAKTEVKSPISGTVTAVYVDEGESASGVMFVIEDTSNLVVTSTVKAYDLDSVKEGMKVKIETDASGDEVFYGVIDSIAPAASKDASGNIVATNDAEFDTVVAIESKSDKLRIGVSAKIKYIIAEAPDAVAVPESAVISDSEESYVLVVSDALDEEGNVIENKVILTKKSVEAGVDDGIYVAVSGIDAGERIVDNAANYAKHIGVELPLSEIDMYSGNGSDMMAMMMQNHPMMQ